jgi:glycerol uptake facilitator-like aquaporin
VQWSFLTNSKTKVACQNIFVKIIRMLQRIQTLFLLAAVAVVLSSFFLPFAWLEVAGPSNAASWSLRTYGLQAMDGTYHSASQTYWIHLPLAFILVLTGWAIFSFKNRKKQLLFLRIVFLMYALSFVLLSMYVNHSTNLLVNPTIQFGPAFFMPFLGLVFSWLAARYIRKDEALIRSVDRIR